MRPDKFLSCAEALVPQGHGGVDDVLPISAHHHKPAKTPNTSNLDVRRHFGASTKDDTYNSKEPTQTRSQDVIQTSFNQSMPDLKGSGERFSRIINQSEMCCYSKSCKKLSISVNRSNQDKHSDK